VADRDRRVAIVAAGYADAYSRGLSNTGFMWISGRRVPILGRVCMQLTAVDVSGLPDVAPGDEIYLLGGQGAEAITADDLAEWWGTIPYEVFCPFRPQPPRISFPIPAIISFLSPLGVVQEGPSAPPGCRRRFFPLPSPYPCT